MKERIKQIGRKVGLNFYTDDRLGVDVDTDLRRFTAYDPLTCIFDVGGNFGQTALRFAEEFPDASILTFEPVPDSFRRLREAVGDHPRIKAFNLALSDAPGTVAMSLTASAGSNSLQSSAATLETINVTVDTIDAVVAENNIGTIDLLKIDVEGFELQVLQGAAKTLRQSKIRYVYAECVLPKDTIAPHTSFFDLHEWLSGHGFSFVSYYAESFRLKDGCALGNVLYALQSRLPEKVSGHIGNVA